jgi:hypothetical protein
VSSQYKILCLSHDPAIEVTTPEWYRPEQAEEAIRAGVEGHENCDLMLGRYSYPLIELGCPSTIPSQSRTGAHKCYGHGSTRWIGVEWVALLFHAQRQPDGSALRGLAGAGEFRCFSPERLRRLRVEMGHGWAEGADGDA